MASFVLPAFQRDVHGFTVYLWQSPIWARIRFARHGVLFGIGDRSWVWQWADPQARRSNGAHPPKVQKP